MEKYRCKCLPMVLSNSPNIFQQKIKYVFQGFEFSRVCIYEHLILIKIFWTDHVHKLELTLNKQKESGIKFDIENISPDKLKWNI